MNEILNTLVTDRTQTDIDRIKELKQKAMRYGINALSADERTEYFNSPKGEYNYTDLNRIGEACDYLYQLYRLNGLKVEGYIAPRTDWVINEKIPKEDMDNFINTLTALKTTFQATQDIPVTMRKLTFESANNIEKLLIELEKQILYFSRNNIYSGETFCGEE